MGDSQWEKGRGEVCRNCGRRYFRGRDGLCYRCWEKENEFAIRDPGGLLSLVDESVIMKIAKKSRKI